MATIANTFALKLDDRDFKTRIDEIAKSTQKYNGQIADSILKQAKLGEQLFNQNLKLAGLRKTGSKDQIALQKKQIQGTKDLLSAERARETGLKKAVALNDKNTKALNANTTAKKVNATATSSLANQTIRYLRWAGTIAGVLYAVNRAWRVTLGTGIEVNKMMEDNTSGIGALLSANTQMVLSNGEVVSSYEKFKMGQIVATKTMDELRKASIKTYATFPQLTEIFQQAIGQTLSMGDAFGSTIEEINSNTIRLTQRISNIAGAIGMPMDRAREEIRSLLSANASTDSLIATMIFGSPTEANKSIRMARERGKNGLVDMLDAVFKPFDALENIDSYTRSLLELEDAWSQLWQTVSKPLFGFLKTTFKDLAKSINEAKDSLVGFNEVAHRREEFELIAEIEEATRLYDILKIRLDQTKKTDGSFFMNILFGDAKELQERLDKQQKVINDLASKYAGRQDTKIDGELQTELAVSAKFLEAQTKVINKDKSKTLQITEKILKGNQEIAVYEERIKIRTNAITADATKRKLLNAQSLVDEQAIDVIKKAQAVYVKDILELQEKAREKESKARDKRFNDIRKTQNAEFKVLTDRDKVIDAQFKKVEDYQNQGFDNWKKQQKEKERESLRFFQSEQDIRKLEAGLINDETQRARALAKLSFEDRAREYQSKKILGELDDQQYSRIMELEEQRQSKIMFGYSNMGQLIQSTSSQMESSFGDFFDFASDKFLDFGDLAQDILHQIYLDMLKMQIVQPLVGVAGSGGTEGTGLMGLIGGFFANEKGGAYSSPSLSAHSNSVVSQTTPFFFANGGVPNLGIMGEAGSEAIMPLTRTSDGDLGVKTVGGANQSVKVNIVNESGQQMEATSSEAEFDMEGMVINIVMDAVQTNKGGMRDAFARS